MPEATGRPAAKRLLVVGLHNSIHVHRWIAMIARPDTAIVLFPSFDYTAPVPEGFVAVGRADLGDAMPAGLWLVRPEETWSEADRAADARAGYRPWSHSFVPLAALASPQTLIGCIRRLRPHLLHAMEMQLAGYLCAEAQRRAEGGFPPWLLSNWGSDIALFRKLPGQAERIAGVCRSIALFLPDCDRDHALARGFGYRGPAVPAMPASGGMDIGSLSRIATVAPARRRLILVKGNHNWAGRGLLALSAVKLAAARLGDCRIGILSPGPPHARWAATMEGVRDVALYPHMPHPGAALALMAQARAVIGVGISDGCPTTMLEAMALGTLPIQSGTACADEWITDGVNGLVVPPHDTRAMADALERAATDDDLVERAARLNLAIVAQRWDASRNAAAVWEIYRGLIERRTWPDDPVAGQSQESDDTREA